MPSRSCTLVVALVLLAAPLRAEDLSQRLEALEREAAARPAPAPQPADPAPPAAPEAAATPAKSRLLQIQERRARGYREKAAAAAQRAQRREQEPGADAGPDVRERDLYAKRAEDVFRAGTAEFQAAYDEWLASEPAP